jgi:hypothetical protein
MNTIESLDKSNISDDEIFFDLSPIFDCLYGCNKCSGTYFSSNFNDFSICKCDCHKDQNRLKIISDNERILGDTAFAEEFWEIVENGGDPNVYL